MKPDLTAEQLERKAEFDAIFDALPGKNIEKLRAVAKVLCLQVNTVRGWRMDEPYRVISPGRLQILRQQLGK